MPIQEQNIVFVESQVMDDVPEGGGAATGNEIVDGKMNNVYPDISDLDRTLGRFNLRKLFLAVRTLSRDLYGGAKSVITGLPTDPALGYTLFTTNDPFDRRTQASNRVEAYLFKGPSWPGVLNGNHISGMQQISVIQRIGTRLPPIGKTLTLVSDEGQSSEVEQYVRVTDVETTEQTFTDADGDFDRWIVSMSLSDPLQFDFQGFEPNRFDSYDFEQGARLRDTTVADAQRYYGSQRLDESADIGDKEIKVASQFTQLVPSARSEESLVNQAMNPGVTQVLDAGARDVEVPQQAHTKAFEVTAENRRQNWVNTLQPRPAGGTLSVAYMAQGNWFVLTDNGDGVLAGANPSIGAGTVSYANGNTNVTLGALPDAGSQLIYTWASPVHYQQRAGVNAINDDYVSVLFQLDNLPAVPNSVTLGWAADGSPRSASIDAAGDISGDGSGELDPITGRGELRLIELPDRGTPLTIDYDWLDGDQGDDVLVTETLPLSATTVISDAAVAGTVRIRIVTAGNNYLEAISTPAGDLVLPKQYLRRRATEAAIGVFRLDNEVTIGTVDHANKEILVTETSISMTRWFYDLGWTEDGESVSIAFGDQTDVTYRVDAAASITETAQQTPSIAQLRLRLVPDQTDSAVPDSVRFSLAGLTYDDANGDLITAGNFDSGQMDYDVGDATLTYWTDGGAVNPNVTSLLTRFGDWLAIEASFRAASNPVAPESMQVVAVAADGEQLTGQSDPDGNIVGDNMQGVVNYQFGLGRVEFGAMGPDPDNPGGPDIWIPRQVDPGTITYNAVAFGFIPLPPDIVGINAVRLPPDGRVPIYRPGDVVMVMHEVENAPETPVQDGGTGPYEIDLGRTRIAWVRVIDDNGDTVTEGFELDRANGILSWDDISALATPVTVRHTVADQRLVIDAQIGGQLSLSLPLTHNFPAGDTIVGSCLLHGDRRARVADTWDEQSWNGDWVDNQVGDAATATLNLIDFPIEVTNEGADTDRWVLRVVNAGSNEWELISENRGLVWSGTYAPGGDDIAPINPRTRIFDEVSGTFVGGEPYMRIPGAANGGGWSSGNVVRINTVGAIVDMWIARSIQQSEAPLDDGVDGVEIHTLGNVNNPIGEE